MLLCSLALYFLNQTVIKNVFEDIKFFHWYFNDLLAPVVALSFLNLLQGIKRRKEIISWRQLIGFCVVCSVFWEWVAIYIKPTSTFDVYDIGIYFLGAFIYKGVASKNVN